MDNKLNDDWINTFEKNDQLYQDFYKDDLYYINIDFIYINKNNDIEKIKHESFLMSTKNSIMRDELIGLLKKNSIDNQKRYVLFSMLKYNITLDADDIKNFLISSDISEYNDQFLTATNHIDTIIFEKTISMFHDLNNLFFIFFEKNKESNENNTNTFTKKIKTRPTSKQNTIKKTI